MSLTLLPAPPHAPSAGTRAARPGLARLTGVELRKAVDTPAGLWLHVAMVVLTVAVVAVRLLVGGPADHTVRRALDAGMQPAAVLLPVLGILLVTAEWSQRTALATFVLVPARSRVLAAKLLAGLVLAVGAWAVAAGIVAAGVLVAAPAAAGTWTDAAPLVAQSAVYLATGTVTGIAFGALLLTAAPAIVLRFALPTALSAVLTLPALDGVGPWIDPLDAVGRMTVDVLGGTEWAQAGTVLALWTVLPLLAGAWRIARREVVL